MRGPNVADPRNPETIRKSNSTVALTRQAMHDGSVPRVPRASAAKSSTAYDAAAPVADIKVDAPGSRSYPGSLLGLHTEGAEPWEATKVFSSGSEPRLPHGLKALPDLTSSP